MTAPVSVEGGRQTVRFAWGAVVGRRVPLRDRRTGEQLLVCPACTAVVPRDRGACTVCWEAL